VVFQGGNLNALCAIGTRLINDLGKPTVVMSYKKKDKGITQAFEGAFVVL